MWVHTGDFTNTVRESAQKVTLRENYLATPGNWIIDSVAPGLIFFQMLYRLTYSAPVVIGLSVGTIEPIIEEEEEEEGEFLYCAVSRKIVRARGTVHY